MKKLIIALLLFSPVAVFAQKFGHVDTQVLMETLPEISRIRGELEAFSKQKENEITTMKNEYDRIVDEYIKNTSTMDEKNSQQEGGNYSRVNQQDSVCNLTGTA